MVENDEFSRDKTLRGCKYPCKTLSGAWLNDSNPPEVVVIPPKREWAHLQTGEMLEECLSHPNYGSEGKWSSVEGILSLNFDDKGNEPAVIQIMPDYSPLSLPAEHEGVASDGRILIAIAFVHELRKLLLSGWLTKYRQEKRVFSGQIKGKMMLQETLRVGVMRGRGELAVCQVSVRSADHPVNRVFRYALQRCRRILHQRSVPNSSLARTWNHLRYCEELLSEVPVPRHICDSDFQIKGLTGFFHRHGQVLHLAKAITRAVPSLGIEHGGVTKIIPFLAYRPLLFEWWLACRLNSLAEQNGWEMKWHSRHILIPGDKRIPSMEPDFVFEKKEGGAIRTLDAKYKRFWENDMVRDSSHPDYADRRNDYHQILAYGYALGADRVGLIFPSSRDSKLPSSLGYQRKSQSPRELWFMTVSPNPEGGVDLNSSVKGFFGS